MFGYLSLSRVELNHHIERFALLTEPGLSYVSDSDLRRAANEMQGHPSTHYQPAGQGGNIPHAYRRMHLETSRSGTGFSDWWKGWSDHDADTNLYPSLKKLGKLFDLLLRKFVAYTAENSYK